MPEAHSFDAGPLAPPAARDPVSCGPFRVLHVEDDPDDAELCRRELLRIGWNPVVDVVSTREAFAVRLGAGHYDVILTDYQLEGWVGTEVVDLLRRMRKEVPVVLVTGSIGEENVAEALRRGIADYVLKHRLDRLPHVIRRLHQDRSERAEKKRLSEERDRFFMLSGDLLCIVDDQGLILQLNPAWHRTLGFDLEEIVRHPLSRWVLPEDRSRLAEALVTLGRGGAAVEFETRCSASDGSIRWLHWKASSMPRQSMIYATARDITDKKVLESQLLRTQRVESIGALANGIAHDLNNVLTPILMAADILMETAVEARSRKLLRTIQSSARHGAAMVKQILTFSRGAEGEKAPLHLPQIVTLVSDFARDTFPKGCEIQTSADPDVWMVNADATQIHQVLLNLCVNARDAMPQGGRLLIEATNRTLDAAYARIHLDARLGPYVVITVSDTGVGIPPSLIERVFEPFFTTKEAGKGTGLGLSTVVGIVRGHGGFLNVYSEPGKGTRFTLYFPALPSEVNRTERVVDRQMNHGNGETVLVIDNESNFRDVTRSMLERFNYRVLTAATGLEALALVTERPGTVALAITDMTMPGMDGTATLRALRQVDRKLRFMATSGMPVADPYCPIEGSPPVDFLLKPYDTPHLLEAVHRALRPESSPVVSP